MTKLLHKQLSYILQGAFFSVYKAFGNAFKESVYHKALIQELEDKGLNVSSQKRINVYYKNIKVGTYVPDLVVDNIILVEIKCKSVLIKNDLSQFWNYLKGSDYKVGYLVNFGSYGGVQFIRRVYDSARFISRPFA